MHWMKLLLLGLGVLATVDGKPTGGSPRGGNSKPASHPSVGKAPVPSPKPAAPALPSTSEGVPAAASVPIPSPATDSDSGMEDLSLPPVDTWFDTTTPDFCNAVGPPMTWQSFFDHFHTQHWLRSALTREPS